MDQHRTEKLEGATLRGRSLREARFVGCDLTGVVVRGSDLAGMELDSPWLLEEGGRLLVNGVDVVPLVDAELDRRFPGRELRRAADPEGLAAAWSALERTWATTLERVAALPAGTVDASVGGEWSVAQTLRHLVHATDVWLGKAILGEDQSFHPLGLANDDPGESDVPGDQGDRGDPGEPPPYDMVLEVRAGRQAKVRDFIAAVTTPRLAETRNNPHDPQYGETVLSCLHTILEEEWEHHRYVVRDLGALVGDR